MGLHLLERRRQIESIYRSLEIVRYNMRSLLTDNVENLTLDNIQILELEEEKLLSRIVKLKSLLRVLKN